MAQKYMFITTSHMDADGNFVEERVKIPCVSADDVVWGGKLEERWKEELESRRSEYDEFLMRNIDRVLCDFGYNLSSEELTKLQQKIMEKGKWY